MFSKKVSFVLFLLSAYFYWGFDFDTEAKEHTEEIDFVVTWRNHSDKSFLNRLNKTLTGHYGDSWNVSLHDFAAKDGLRYALRSIEKYAPWVRFIHIVTNGQIPYWLDLSNEKIKLTVHRDFFANKTVLPTFCSAAIEHSLHRIRGLSKQFIYIDQDMFLNAPVEPEDFLNSQGEHVLYMGDFLQSTFDVLEENAYCKPDCTDGLCAFDQTPGCQSKDTPDILNKSFIEAEKRYTSKFRAYSTHEVHSRSLDSTGRTLEKAFGLKQRREGSLGAIMIHKEIGTEIVNVLEEEVNATVSNHLCLPGSLQFHTLYYNFILEHKFKINMVELFNYFDSDKSSSWSTKELSNIDIPVKDYLLENCSELDVGSDKLEIRRRTIEKCPSLTELLLQKYGEIKYPSKIIEAAHSVKVLRSDFADAVTKLKDVIREQRKFVYIKEDLDVDAIAENMRIRNLLKNFFGKTFPEMSRFELVEGKYNRFSSVYDFSYVSRTVKFWFRIMCALASVIFVFKAMFSRPNFSKRK